MEELNFLGFAINPAALECWICHAAPKPHSRCRGPHLYLCGAGHLVCGSCIRAHESQCGGSLSPDCCRWLEEMASRILVECCGVIFPYCKLEDHQADCFTISSISHSAWRKCMLKKEFLSCSVCGATVRPPIFKSYDLVCPDCYNASTTKDDFFKYPELDYFFKCMTVTRQVPCFSPCDNVETNRAVVAANNIIFGTTNGKDPSKVGKTDKHVVEARRELKACKRVAGASFKTFPSDKIENVATASGKKADEYESTRPPVANNTNNGKSKGEAPPNVREMDSDSEGSSAESSDDIVPEAGKRVAETVFKSTASDMKKAKIGSRHGWAENQDMLAFFVDKMQGHPAN